MRPEPRSAPRRVMPWGEIPRGSFPGDGLAVIDKDPGVTSHDVVGAVRRLAGTKKVGHAGTLDPMATGVLCIGLGRATKLLRYVTGTAKEYEATIRFGIETSTEDAQGEIVRARGAREADAAELARAMANLTGDVLQVPSSVSALKVEGRRAYDLVREGREVVFDSRRCLRSGRRPPIRRGMRGARLRFGRARCVRRGNLRASAGARSGGGTRIRRAPDVSQAHASRPLGCRRGRERARMRRRGGGRRTDARPHLGRPVPRNVSCSGGVRGGGARPAHGAFHRFALRLPRRESRGLRRPRSECCGPRRAGFWVRRTRLGIRRRGGVERRNACCPRQPQRRQGQTRPALDPRFGRVTFLPLRASARRRCADGPASIFRCPDGFS